MTVIEHEKQMVAQMIHLYCRHKHGLAKGKLCAECTDLLTYAHYRLEHCKFGEQKTTCRRCSIHCYRSDMRQRIAAVMRYAGPWMLLYSPWATLRHLLQK